MATLNWQDLKIGERYKYEEGYYLQAEVIVLDKRIIDNYIDVDLKVVKADYNCKKNDIINAGKTLDKNYAYLSSKHLFKTLDDMYDYGCAYK